MLQHRLLIGFLNTSLGNNGQKTFKRHFLNHIWHSVSLFLLYFLLWNNQKNMCQNEIKDLTFEVSNLSITFFFLNNFL